MKERNPNPLPGTPALNESQARRLRVTCQYIDKLLGDIESVLTTTSSKAAFPRYFSDISPTQRRTIEDYIGRVRAQLTRVLEGQSIPREKPQIPASRAVHVMLGAVDIAVEELKPKYMRGYGDVPESVATELNGIVGELSGLVSRLDRYLSQGVGQDLQVRLERLGQAGNDLRLLGKIEKIVEERGLVEFRSGIAAILDRAEDRTFEIAVFGRVSAGKSSLLNAILETDVLPVGVTPITAVPTRITHAAEPSLTVWFSEAPAKTLEIGRLAEFATEQQNSGNSKQVTRIVVSLPSPRLRGGVSFVDTPGLGSLATSGAAETLAYLPKCDLGVVLIDAGSTLSIDDLQTIEILQEAAVPVNVLLSKADLLGSEDRARIIQYVKEHIASECKLDLPVRPVSILPSFREMTNRWFECEIVPLYGQSQQLRATSLRRKIGALRESVASALKSRMKRDQQFSATSQEQIRAAESLLRRTTGQVEEMRSLCEREIARAAAEMPVAIQEAASQLMGSWFRNHGGVAAPGQMVRDVIAHSLQQQVKKLQDDLSTFAAQLRDNLKQCAFGLGLADTPADEEFQNVIRGTPVFDPQAFTITMSRPSISRVLGRRFAERQVARQIERQLGQPFQEALDIYWRLLKKWSDSIVGQLRQIFETYAENYRAQAEQALGGRGSSMEDRDAIRTSLVQLEADSALESDLTNTESAHKSCVPETGSKTV
ncbi:MAG: dynamin family protein [Candidatus Acidiferrales bacterium]